VKLPCAFSIRQAEMIPDLSPLVVHIRYDRPCVDASGRSSTFYPGMSQQPDKTAPKKIVVSSAGDRGINGKKAKHGGAGAATGQCETGNPLLVADVLRASPAVAGHADRVTAGKSCYGAPGRLRPGASAC
jgi:hypothetical protein